MNEPRIAIPAGRFGEEARRRLEQLAPVDEIHALGDLNNTEDHVVLLGDESLLAGHAPDGLPASVHCVVVTVGREPTDLWSDAAFLHLPENPGPLALQSAVRRALEEIHQFEHRADLESNLLQRTRELEAVNKIGVALSTVRDHDVLLEMILSKCRELSRADAGSLYLIDPGTDGESQLRWKLAQNDSIDVSFQERTLPITRKSLAGTVALTGETLVLDDAYDPPEDAEYEINRTFDLENGYLTRSMVVLPMTNNEGQIIGVLQLINRKREGAPERLSAETVPQWVVPFDPQTIHLVRTLTAQAAVALENNILYESISRLFEGFVTASVTAIEQRDPTTSGHSFRVAELTCELARIIDGIGSGPLADVRFTGEQVREIRYASLLHDFGKVGVRENVLVKEKKLYPLHMEVIRSRFDSLIRNEYLEAEREKNRYLLEHGRERFDEFVAELEERTSARVEALRRDYELIESSNEPTVLPEGSFEALERIATRTLASWDGREAPLLSPEEVRFLSIRRGNLDQEERREIESHVTHTFRFLSKIPWTGELRKVPEIAWAHHEKLNGRGYPRGLSGTEIPVQSRMMTVSDIYDALTAADRPYKKALPSERALQILEMETKDGLLDADLVQVFLEAKVWERVARSVPEG